MVHSPAHTQKKTSKVEWIKEKKRKNGLQSTAPLSPEIERVFLLAPGRYPELAKILSMQIWTNLFRLSSKFGKRLHTSAHERRRQK